MTSDEALLAAFDALESCQVPYMVVGSLSSNYYGIPRATKDADFVLQVDEGTISRLLKVLPDEMFLDRQMSFEGITCTTRHIIKIAKSNFKIELFMLTDDPYDQERFRRRVRQRILDREVFLPTPEDVVVTKLRWSKRGRRYKDLDDAKNVIKSEGESFDWDYIHKWCTDHGTMDLLRELRDSIPPI